MPYQFHGQRPNEEVILVSHRHPFVLLHVFLGVVLLLLIPLFAYVFFELGMVVAVVLIVCLIAAISWGSVGYHTWKNTLFLLTNERVVFLHQKSFFQREFVECPLSTITQVSHQVKGVAHTLWGYGTLMIAASAAMGLITIPDLPDPYEIQQEIQRAAAGEQKEGWKDEPEQ